MSKHGSRIKTVKPEDEGREGEKQAKVERKRQGKQKGG